MNRLFSRFLTVISCMLLAVAPVNKTRSCGPDLDADDARFMLFRHELTEPGLSAFHYTPHFLQSDNADPAENDMHRNCDEWAKATGGHVRQKEVYMILYKTRPEEFMYAYESGQWKGLAENAFVKWLLQKEHKEYLQYLAFARMVEYDQFGEKDPWSDNTEGSRLNSDSLATMALPKCEEHKGGFLTERYAFQAEKLLYYLSVNINVIEGVQRNPRNMEIVRLKQCYEKYLRDKNTIVADWGLLYYGLSMSNNTEITKCLLNTFDRCVEKRVFIYNYLHLKDVNQLEQATHDARMLAVIHAFKAVKNPGRALDEIKQVYKYDAGSKYLPLLISREVNKLEAWILSGDQQGFDIYAKKNIEKDKRYLSEMKDFLVDMYNKQGVHKEFLQLAIIHLCHAASDYKGAEAYLTGNVHFSKPEYEVQYRIEQAISIINTRDMQGSAARNDLNSVFVALEKAGITTDTSVDYNYDYYNRKKDIMSELYLMLCNKLKEKGDIVTSGLVFRKSRILVNQYYGFDSYIPADDFRGNWYGRIAWFDKYASPADVDSLVRLKHKGNKTPFEQRFCAGEWGNEDMYRDVKTTILLRQGRYEEALAVANTMADSFWDKNYEFRNHLRRRSVTSVEHLLPAANGSEGKYPIVSKKAILKDIVAIRAALKVASTDSARAQLYFLLGNCMYNITWHGKDWMMFSYGKTWRECDKDNTDYIWAYFSFYPNDIKYGEAYYECKEAMKMYTEALKYTGSNKELGAQCVLMLSRCDSRATRYKRAISVNNRAAFYSNYLAMLKKDYRQTEIYDRSITECPDVEEYVKKYGR